MHTGYLSIPSPSYLFIQSLLYISIGSWILILIYVLSILFNLFSYSHYSHFSHWELFLLVPVSLWQTLPPQINVVFLCTSLLLALRKYISYPSHSISHFPKEPFLLLLKKTRSAYFGSIMFKMV